MTEDYKFSIMLFITSTNNFLVTNQSEVLSKQTAPRKAQNSKSTSSKDPSNDMQVLLLQIESLQAQIEEQAKLAKDQEESLLEDRKVRMEEQNAQRQRDADKIKALTEHLHKTQTLLYESTKDFLELKYEGRRKERRWMMERDTIMQEMDAIKEQLDIEKSDVIEVGSSIFCCLFCISLDNWQCKEE